MLNDSEGDREKQEKMRWPSKGEGWMGKTKLEGAASLVFLEELREWTVGTGN